MQSHSSKVIWFNSPQENIPGPLKFEIRVKNYKEGGVVYEYIPDQRVENKSGYGYHNLSHSYNQNIRKYYLNTYKDDDTLYIEPFYNSKNSLFISASDVKKLEKEMPIIFSSEPDLDQTNLVQETQSTQTQTKNSLEEITDDELIFSREKILAFGNSVKEFDEPFLNFPNFLSNENINHDSSQTEISSSLNDTVVENAQSSINNINLNNILKRKISELNSSNSDGSKKQKTNQETINKTKIEKLVQAFHHKKTFDPSILTQESPVINKEKIHTLFQEMTAKNDNKPTQFPEINKRKFQTVFKEFVNEQNPYHQLGPLTTTENLPKRVPRKKKKENEGIDQGKININYYTNQQDAGSLGNSTQHEEILEPDLPFFSETLYTFFELNPNPSPQLSENSEESAAQEDDAEAILKFLHKV